MEKNSNTCVYEVIVCFFLLSWFRFDFWENTRYLFI